MTSLSVRSILPHADAVSMPSRWEKYIASKWLKKRLKKELNLSFETASRSAKDCTPRRKIALSSALSCRAHVRSPHCAVRTFTADCRRSFVCSLIWTAINEGRDSDKHSRQLPDGCE